MKRLLSLLLCIVLVFSIISVSAVTSGAVTTRPLFLDEEHDAQLTDTDDVLYYSYYAGYDGYFEFYSMSDFDLFVTVKDRDGNVVTTDDNSNGGGDFKATIYMHEGDVYIFEVTAYDIFHDGRFSVYIKESRLAITSLEITKLPDKLEYEYGTVQYDVDYSGLELKATMNNGATVNWSYNTDSKYINGCPLTFSVDYKKENPVVEISCGAAKTSFELTVLPSDIESIEILNKTPIYFYENSGGYYDEDEGFYYYCYDTPQFEIKVTYTDKSTEIVSIYDDVNDMSFSVYDNQLSENFTLGENPVYVELGGAKDVFYVSILESPVSSCTVAKAPIKEYLFGDEEFFSYNEYTDVYTLSPSDLSGIEFTVQFKDGTQKTFTDEDIDTDTHTIDGNKYYVLPCIVTEHGVYKVTLNFIGYDITYDVTVLPKNSTILGDVDGDGVVSILDATAIQLHLAQLTPLSDKQLALADTDHDGEVTVLDATQIQLSLANLI